MKRCRIVLIEDDQDDQFIFTSAVKEIKQAVECDCYDNAEIALNALTSGNEKPDGIFLDLNLPFMHGLDFLKLIKTRNDLSDIPVVIYSTSSRDSDKKRAAELGASYFITKPNSYEETVSSISDVFDAARSQ